MDKVEELLDLYSLEELFEILDITSYEVVQLLVRSGMVTLPPFLEEFEDARKEYETEGA